MRKVIKKKKELRNGVRVDNTYSNLLRQFNLSGRSTTQNGLSYKMKFRAKPSSILYICLALGLSIGIGSAFADKEIFPSQKPLDQPIQQKIESSRLTEAKEKHEILPQDPKPELQLERQPQVPKEDAKEDKLEKQVNQEETKQHGKQAEVETKEATPSHEEMSKNKPLSATTPHEEMDTEKSVHISSSENEDIRKTVPTPSVSSSSTTVSGAKLPATAGNHGNHILFGMTLALVGSFLLRRKWMKF